MSIQKQMKNTVYYVHNDNPKLPVIIMIHGFRGTHHGLELIAKNLSEYRIIIPDLPGFGETKPLTDEHSLDNYTAWLHDFISDLKLSKPPILLGHSFGSIVAGNYASLHPKTIEKLILVNPIGAPALEGSQAIMTQFTLLGHKFSGILPEKLAKKLLSAKPAVMAMSITMAKTNDKKLRKFIHSEHLQHFSSFYSSKMVTEAFKTSINNNVRDFAAKINTPTLLIVGDKDDITPLSKQHELVKLFRDAKIKVIKNVGHLTHYETPDKVAGLIKDFVH
jgi:pimeloyl-ACP methyl ester carboxylesterase